MASESTAGRRPRLLAPVMLLTDRLRTSARLAALVVVLLVPGVFATWSYTSAVAGQIRFSSLERDGVAVVEPALIALGETVGTGSTDLAALESAVAAHPELGLGGELRVVQQATESPQATTAAGRLATAEALADLVTEAGNASNLILDPDLDSYYVMDALVIGYPRVLVAAAHAAAPPERASQDELIARQAVDAGRLQGTADALEAGVATAVDSTADPELRSRLTGVLATAEAVDTLADELTAGLAEPSAVDPAPVAALAVDSVGPAATALDALLEARIAEMSQARQLTTLVTVFGIGLALWLAAAVWWRSRRDVSQLLLGVRAIADGNLAQRALPAGRDELGEIGRALDGARERLAESGRRLEQQQAERDRQQQVSFTVQKDAERQIRTRAQAIIDETASTVTQELSEVVRHVHAMREAAGTIDDQVTSADRVASVVIEHVKTTDGVVGTLGDSLRRVAGITELIASVADQSKLLALNATIEAARAGEVGQGFAVVAGEVKNLATTTGSSTTEISTTVAALERDTTAVSGAIQEMSASIAELDAATTTLRTVAEQQRLAVRDFEQILEQAVDRVRRMSGLSDRLERRRHERYAVTTDAALFLKGREHTVHIADLSESGARLILSDQIRPIVDTHIELAMPKLVGERRVAARVARLVGDGGEIGIEFMALEPQARQEIVAFLASLERGDRDLDG